MRQQNTMAALAIANVLKVRCVCLLLLVCLSLGRSTRATAFHANHTTNYNNDTTTNDN